MDITRLRATAAVSAVVASGLALAAAPSLAQSSLPTLTLAVSKNSITVGGQLVSGAVDVATTVSGEQEDSPTLILLKPGVSAAQFQSVTKGFSNSTPLDAIDKYATIVYSSGSAHAGQTTTGTALLPAGNYVAVNNGEGFTPFTIAASASPAALPTPQATVTAIDLAFRGATTLHDGELVKFENAGYLIHMFEVDQAKNVAEARKAEAALRAGDTNAAKKHAIAPPLALAGPLSSEQAQESVITAPPGVYVLFCEMNTQDGREHFELGMYRTIKIVK